MGFALLLKLCCPLKFSERFLLSPPLQLENFGGKKLLEGLESSQSFFLLFLFFINLFICMFFVKFDPSSFLPIKNKSDGYIRSEVIRPNQGGKPSRSPLFRVLFFPTPLALLSPFCCRASWTDKAFFFRIFYFYFCGCVFIQVQHAYTKTHRSQAYIRMNFHKMNIPMNHYPEQELEHYQHPYTLPPTCLPQSFPPPPQSKHSPES